MVVADRVTIFAKVCTTNIKLKTVSYKMYTFVQQSFIESLMTKTTASENKGLGKEQQTYNNRSHFSGFYAFYGYCFFDNYYKMLASNYMQLMIVSPIFQQIAGSSCEPLFDR